MSLAMAPGCTVKLALAGLTVKSGGRPTLIFRLAELLVASGSGSLAEMLALLVHWPALVNVTGIVTVAVADATTDPRVQVIWPFEGAAHDP